MSVSGVVRWGDPVHAAFQSWLARGADGEPEPATALHAVACESCRNAIAAVDSLQAMDTARSDLPALSPPEPPTMFAGAGLCMSSRRPRSSSWPWPRSLAPGRSWRRARVADNGTPDLWHIAFGGAGSLPSLFGSPSPSASTESATPSPSDEQQVQPGQGFPPGFPVATSGPLIPSPAPGATPPPRTPPPGSSGTPSASGVPNPTPPPTVAPTPTPPPSTPPPTPEPTPLPTPVPTANANCFDGIDNDGDGLVDQLDPGCLLVLGDEFAL